MYMQTKQQKEIKVIGLVSGDTWIFSLAVKEEEHIGHRFLSKIEFNIEEVSAARTAVLLVSPTEDIIYYRNKKYSFKELKRKKLITYKRRYTYFELGSLVVL